MTIFAIMGLNGLDKLGAAISQKYPADSIKVSPTQWFIVDSSTTKEVSEKLGITSGTAGDAVVVSISGYWGRAPNTVWEWLHSRWAK